MAWPSRETFTARYPGRCDACGERFNAGDEIGMARDYNKPLCEDCWDRETDGGMDADDF